LSATEACGVACRDACLRCGRRADRAGELRKFFRGSFRFHKLVELAQEFVGAKLVGIIGFEIRKERIVVIAQRGFGGTHALHLRNRPRPRTRAAARVADVRRQRIAFLNFWNGTGCGTGRRRSFLRRFRFFALAPHGGDEFSVDAIGQAAFREVVPEEAGAGIVDVGDSLLQREFIGHAAAGIVGPLLAAIADGPGLLVVVGGGGGGRPDVAVAGNFSAVVEVVEHSELQGQLVLVGRDVFAVHGQRWVAIAHGQIAEDLIVGAIFFQNVDHVADGILSARRIRTCRHRSGKIVFFDLLRVGGQILVDVGEAEALDGTADQRRNVGMLFSLALAFQRALACCWGRCLRLWRWR
jgi:hypothetical protein